MQDFYVILMIYPQNSKKILHILPDLAYPVLVLGSVHFSIIPFMA